jgi:hypothetical protein
MVVLNPFPSRMGWHGLSPRDSVTVWFLSANWNWRMSPGSASTLLGVNVKSLPPTTMGITLLTVGEVAELTAVGLESSHSPKCSRHDELGETYRRTEPVARHRWKELDASKTTRMWCSPSRWQPKGRKLADTWLWKLGVCWVEEGSLKGGG